MVAVVIPTIHGREHLLAETFAAYRANTHQPTKLMVVRDRPTIGHAWTDGASIAAADPQVTWIHLAADDVTPHDGWDTAAITAAEHGLYPSPRIVNTDGTLHSCGTLGGGMLLPDCADGTPCGTSPFPFLRATMWHRVGPCLPIGYYADDHLAFRARLAGLTPTVCRGYALTHLEGTVGRAKTVSRADADRAAFLASVGVESPHREAVPA